MALLPSSFTLPVPTVKPTAWPAAWPDAAPRLTLNPLVSSAPDQGHRFSIEAFKSAAARRGLAKGFFFKCHFYAEFHGNDPKNPSGKWMLDRDTEYFCRSATLPAAIVQAVELKYHTRSIKIPGAREVQPFTCTFFNTIQRDLRTSLLEWQEKVSTARATNLKETPRVSFYGTIHLDHYNTSSDAPAQFLVASAEHELIGQYVMTQAWPSSIGAPAFSQDNEEFQTFDVTFEHLDLQYRSKEELKGPAALTPIPISNDAHLDPQ